jgi:hypothetical protein
MKAGHKYFTVKALIDTSSTENFISKSLADKLKNSVGKIEWLDISFRYKGKDRLLSDSDEVLNDFEVIEEPKADLVLGLPWLWLREAIIDIRNGGIKIYGKFVPFCKKAMTYDTTDSESSSDSSDTEYSSVSSDTDLNDIIYHKPRPKSRCGHRRKARINPCKKFIDALEQEVKKPKGYFRVHRRI